MDTGGLIWIYFVLISVCVCAVSGNPIGTSVINCNEGGNIEFGPVDEGFSGDVELATGITAGSNVELVPYLFPTHLEFLELIFTVGETTATVCTKKPLDADILAASDSTLYYSIVCDGEIKYNNTRTLKITDLNDNSPVFTEKLYSITVSEAEPVNTEVLQVKADDADITPAYNEVTYSMEPTSEDFMMTSSGALILKRPLNYNVVQSYGFTVTAQDSGGSSDSTTVQINVQDVDNLNPYFLHNLYQAFIPENQVGFFRTVEPEAIKALDGDTGINTNLIYSISSVTPEKYRATFNIDSISGIVSVVTAIDREEMNSSTISVNIKAAQTDDPLKTADAVVSVTVEDIHDNTPEFEKSEYSETVLENSPVDAVVFKATVIDLDQGGFVGTMRIIPESAPFFISSDGTVTVKDSTALDRETTKSFIFQIEATETNPPNTVTRAQVNVTLLDENDNSPEFSSNTYEGKVFANQTVGMLLVQVKAEDQDDGINRLIKYSFTFGNDDGYFSIDEDTGAISLAKTIPLVDNEIKQFPLYITATDGGIIPCSSSAQVNIQAVGNSKPQFSHKVYRGTIEEEHNPGVVIVKVNFNAMGNVTLQVVTEADKFAISPIGVFTNKVKLDYDEAPHNYSVEISISDGATRDIAVVEVQVTDINDNSPVFASDSTTISVPEDVEVGSNVTVVSATDKDSSFNKEIRYSLIRGDGTFFIHPLSGMVSVAGELDRETKAEYNLQVVAKDRGQPARSSTATLLVKVSDINDNVPKFSEAEYKVEVLETESVGTTVLSLSAADPDEGANGKVTYSIFQQSPSSDPAVFELDSLSGTLRLVQPLDYSRVKVYSLMVQASDGGTPSLVGNSSVVVKVKVVNNHPPEFSKESYDVSVFENLASGAPFLTLEVTDRDEDGFSNGYFLYSNDTFDINKQGVVSLRKNVTLDRETKDNYLLQVLAVDQVTNGLTGTAQVRVQVEDVNEAPQFPPEVYKASVFSNDPNKTPVIQVKASDPDVGDEGQLEYSLVSGSPYFDVDASSGLVFVVSVGDLSGKTATVEVKVTDPKGLNATAKVEVEVLGSTSRNDVVTISLNQPANIVEKNIPEMEKSLGKALGWTVDIIKVSNSTRGSPKSRTLREAAKSLVNFIAVDKAEVVSYGEVVKKLQSESAAVTSELTKVFGEDVQFAVEERPKDPDSDNLALTISLGVIVPVVIILVLIFVLKRTGSFRHLINFGKQTEDQAMKMDRQSNRRQ